MSSFRFIVLARSILFGAFIALILGIGAVDETRAQGPLGKILSKMDAYNKNLSSLTANVIMVKTDSFLKSSDVTKGNTAYLPETEKRPRYIIVNWTEPITEHILVIGSDYKLYSPHRKFAFEGKTDNAQGNAKVGTAFAFIGMSAEQRRANFTAEYVDLEKLKDGTPAWHLILKPMAKANFKFADVWINTDGLPQQTRITAMNDDHTTILLTNISGNKKLDAKLFKLSYKKGTVIQKV